MPLWLVLALVLAIPSQRHWVDIDSETQRIAEDKLSELQRDGDARSGRAAPDFKNAQLDQPLYYYADDAGFASLASDPSDDLMPYLSQRNAIYPVVVENKAIGVLLFKSSLGKTCYFGPVPPGIYADYREALRRVRLERDQRLSIAATRGGDYLLVEDGTTIYRMAPCTTRTLLMLGLDNQHVDDFKFVDPKELVPLIKRAMRGGE